MNEQSQDLIELEASNCQGRPKSLFSIRQNLPGATEILNIDYSRALVCVNKGRMTSRTRNNWPKKTFHAKKVSRRRTISTSTSTTIRNDAKLE